MNNNISILVADNHPMLLKGLTDEFLNLDYMVYSATNGSEALSLIISKKPTIAFLDINMPFLTGFEVIRKCQLAAIETKFIIFTASKQRGYMIKATKMNISGYLLKDEPFSVIIKCTQDALKGGFYSSALFNQVFTNEISPEIKKIKLLSPSERTIVRLITDGKSTKVIAKIIDISPRTVEKHRSNIISKLDLSSGSDSLSDWVIENKEILENI